MARRKYRNVKSEVDGVKWDSLWELRCWQIFKSLERQKKIFSLRRQVKFPFIHNDVKIGTYVADFTFRLEKSGKMHVADAKSKITASTQSWGRTVKMMRAFYSLEVHMIFNDESDPEKLVLQLMSERDTL